MLPTSLSCSLYTRKGFPKLLVYVTLYSQKISPKIVSNNSSNNNDNDKHNVTSHCEASFGFLGASAVSCISLGFDSHCPEINQSADSWRHAASSCQETVTRWEMYVHPRAKVQQPCHHRLNLEVRDKTMHNTGNAHRSFCPCSLIHDAYVVTCLRRGLADKHTEQHKHACDCKCFCFCTYHPVTSRRTTADTVAGSLSPFAYGSLFRQAL